MTDHAAQACQDCPATVTVTSQQGVTGPVTVVGVVHAATCPWFAAIVGEPVAVTTPSGVIVHTVASES